MDYLVFLAEATAKQNSGSAFTGIDFIWEQITSLSWLQAVIFISFGTVYLIYGWRIFKIFVTINFAILGIFLGLAIGQRVGQPLWGAIAGVVIMGALSIPLMRWAVSILGAIAGGVLTAAIWYAIRLPNEYIMAGALVGIIAGGMISFIVYKIAIMLFTSLQGGVLIVTGTLALLYLYPQTSETIHQLVYQHQWFVPALLLATTTAGMVLQNKFIKTSPNWAL